MNIYVIKHIPSGLYFCSASKKRRGLVELKNASLYTNKPGLHFVDGGYKLISVLSDKQKFPVNREDFKVVTFWMEESEEDKQNNQ